MEQLSAATRLSLPIRPSLLAALVTLSAAAAAARAPEGSTADRPRLVVMVSVDQLVPEQLERLAPVLDGGLGRFVREGRLYRSAALGYARTETGPGHATLATGTYPSTHGVVGNRFFDRDARALVYCVGDPETLTVNAAGVSERPGSVSPRALRAPALGDMLAAGLGACRTVSIAGKDRAAVTMGGHEPVAALWWDRSVGGFATSTYYVSELPEWVSEWNSTWAERYSDFAAGGWAPVGEDLTGSGTAADQRPGEVSPLSAGCVFPYPLPPADATAGPAALARAASSVYSSPLGDAFVLSLASTAVRELELGTADTPDFLALGLSACDVVGHAFGPMSQEVTDVLLRADDALGEFFDELDERLGSDGWIACLSADHGVLELPEALVARGVDARRVPGAELITLRDSIIARFQDVFGSDLGFDYIGGLIFDEAAILERELDPREVWELAAVGAREGAWVARAFTYADLREADPDAEGVDPLLMLMARSVAEGRGPDVSIIQRPWTLLAMPSGTSHGTPYEYDRRVPLAFLGPGFEPGESFARAGAVDAVPTLLAALRVALPQHLDGRALVEPVGE